MNLTKQCKPVKRVLMLALLLTAGMLVAACGPQTQERVYRVGILSGLDYLAVLVDGFKTRMAELGYVEGKNIVYDLQKTNFEPDRERDILRQFVKDDVDLIFTFPTEVSMAAKTAVQGTEIPVVFAIANIEGIGLVDSVTRPGGNITGVRYPGPDLAIKRFEIMRELAPGAKRMWVPYQKGYPIVASQLEVLYPIAASAGVTLIEFPADNAAGIQGELDAKNQQDDIGMDAILFLAEPLTVSLDAFAVMGRFAYEHKLPIGGALMQAGAYGSIFGINVDLPETGSQAAVMIDKILRGTHAGTLPLVSSESNLEINYKVAQTLGVPISKGLLSRADKIIH